MDHFHGPGPWTPCHGPGPWTVFLFLYEGFAPGPWTLKTEIVPKKDLMRHCRPMHTTDHKYLVVFT